MLNMNIMLMIIVLIIINAGSIILGIKIGKGLKEPLLIKPKFEQEESPTDAELFLQEKLSEKAGKLIPIKQIRKEKYYNKTDKQEANSE